MHSRTSLILRKARIEDDVVATGIPCRVYARICYIASQTSFHSARMEILLVLMFSLLSLEKYKKIYENFFNSRELMLSFNAYLVSPVVWKLSPFYASAQSRLAPFLPLKYKYRMF